MTAATPIREWLAKQPGRCPEGFAPVQHPKFCMCPAFGGTDWQVFVTVLRQVARRGRVHQRDVRPLISGRIAPHAVGQLYARAKREGLIVEVGREASNDVRGRNTNKREPIYELRPAA